MRLSRIYIAQPLRPGIVVDLDAQAARYIGQVLRLRAGDSFTLFDGSGRDYTAELMNCERKACRAHIGEVSAGEKPARLQLHLAIGISRGERMDLAIQKSVELGVTEITPLQTERSVVQLSPDRVERRITHWQGVIIGACEQSGRSLLPRLHPPAVLGDWLSDRRHGVLLDHRAALTLSSLPDPGESLTLLVGPEGGLSEAEREMASRSGFTGVRLGPRVMRTETAPLAALAAIQTLWGDFR